MIGLGSDKNKCLTQITPLSELIAYRCQVFCTTILCIPWKRSEWKNTGTLRAECQKSRMLPFNNWRLFGGTQSGAPPPLGLRDGQGHKCVCVGFYSSVLECRSISGAVVGQKRTRPRWDNDGQKKVRKTDFCPMALSDVAQLRAWPPLVRFLSALFPCLLVMRIMLATVCCRVGSWVLVMKLNFCTDFEHFGQDFEVEVQAWFWSWSLVNILLLMFGWGYEVESWSIFWS